MYLIDTDVISELRKPRPNDNAVRWMSRQRPDDLSISVVTVMEIERGIQKQRSTNADQARVLENWLSDVLARYEERILPVSTAVALRWGKMRIILGRDDMDIAIAASAIEHNLTIVTRNVRHFDKTGAAVLNPFEPVP